MSATTNTFYVGDTGMFRSGDVVVVGKELAEVASVGTNSILVARGLVPERSPAASHATGTRVAAVVTFWPGTVVMDLSTYCPRVTVDPAVGPETWAEYNARMALSRVSRGGWDGILLDRSDSNLSGIVDGPWTRSIDPKRSNTPVADGYAISSGHGPRG